MAQWQRTLDIADAWKAAEDGGSTIDLARVIVERLSALKPIGRAPIDEERDEILHEFTEFAADGIDDREQFDDLMWRLYEWGDTSLDNGWNGRKVCWVDRFG